MNMIHQVLARAGAGGGGGCGTLLSSVDFVCACSNPFRLVLPNHVPPFPSLSWESGGVYLILLVVLLISHLETSGYTSHDLHLQTKHCERHSDREAFVQTRSRQTMA